MFLTWFEYGVLARGAVERATAVGAKRGDIKIIHTKSFLRALLTLADDTTRSKTVMRFSCTANTAFAYRKPLCGFLVQRTERSWIRSS